MAPLLATEKVEFSVMQNRMTSMLCIWLSLIFSSMWLLKNHHLIVLIYNFYICQRNFNTNMWHDQVEWVTCRQYSILSFQYKSPFHLTCYILTQTPSQSDIWLQRYEQFFKFKNNVKYMNISPLLACNSKSIYSRHPTHSPWSCHILSACF